VTTELSRLEIRVGKILAVAPASLPFSTTLAEFNAETE
jgi:hypothetical protein